MGRKRNGFVTLKDEQEGISIKQSRKLKKSSSKQHQSFPKLTGKSKRGIYSIRTNEDESFRQQLEEDGTMSINEMASDGNCLFRSLSDQLYHDYGKSHEGIRQDVCDYIQVMEDEFSVFLVLDENEEDEDAANFEEYIAMMRSEGEWGGNLELVAAAKLYRRNIQVFSTAANYTINHGNLKSQGPDLMVSYHDNDHYNSVRSTSGNKPPLPIKFMPRVTAKCITPTSENHSMDDSLKTTDSTLRSTSKDEESNSKSSKIISKSNRRRSAPCPCGSGIKYKECCRKKEKSISKTFEMNKESSNHGDETSYNKKSSDHLQPEQEEDPKIEGAFRMLKI